MIYGYIRVSTDRQTVENQRFEIKRFCKDNDLQVDKWISETISGAKEVDKRRLGKLLKGVQKDDIIICSEISRLGRSLFMIMSVLNHCMEIGAKVWTIKDNYRLGDDITSKVLAFAFGLSAEIERKLISQRTREALARKKSEDTMRGVTIWEFCDAIKTVIKKYSFPYLDLTSQSGFAPGGVYGAKFRAMWTRDFDNTGAGDGVHPNAAYNLKYLAPQIMRFIRGLI